MSSARTVRQTGKTALPWLVSAIGVLSFATMLLRWIWFGSVLDLSAYVVSFGTVGASALGLIWSGYRLASSTIDTERYGRIFQWCLGGAIGFLAINVFVMAFFPSPTLVGNVAWAHFSINTGAVAGFAVGYVEARAIQREVRATAADVRATQLEEEREVLAYLNDLLRHEVLNSTQIIRGHASLLLEEVDDRQARSHLETIDRESEALTDVIDDVRAMLDATRKSNRSDVIDLGDLLRGELTRLQRRFDDVDVDAAIPESESMLVEGNDGIAWIFSNVLENAVEHNDSDRPRVEVTVETKPQTVAVRIGDNGPGIGPETRETLFERKSENHGLGLYFVRILANRYGGSVELTDTGTDGSVFTVTLPRAAERDRGSSADPTVGSEPPIEELLAAVETDREANESTRDSSATF